MFSSDKRTAFHLGKCLFVRVAYHQSPVYDQGRDKSRVLALRRHMLLQYSDYSLDASDVLKFQFVGGHSGI